MKIELFTFIFSFHIILISSQARSQVHNNVNKAPSIPNNHLIKLFSSESKTTNNEISFNYKLDDGQQRDETVSILNFGTDNEFILVKGFYEYFGSNNRKYRVDYVADQNGYRANVQVVDSADVSYINFNVLKSAVG